MDIYREHIAEELGKASGIEPELIFSRLAWTNTLDKGDLSLPVCLRSETTSSLLGHRDSTAHLVYV